MGRIENLEQDIRFTRYRMSFPLCAVTRTALEQRLNTLQQELDAARAQCEQPRYRKAA